MRRYNRRRRETVPYSVNELVNIYNSERSAGLEGKPTCLRVAAAFRWPLR